MADDDSTTKHLRGRFFEIASSAPVAEPVQLKLWPDDKRGAPNAMLRSELFCSGKPPAKREAFEGLRLIESLAPYTVSYTGHQLYQPDLDVWLELVHRMRLAIGEYAVFHTRSFLKALSRSVGKSDREWLTATFMRLRATAIHVKWRDETSGKSGQYIGGLVESLRYDPLMKVWHAKLDPKIVDLFVGQDTWLHCSVRRALGKSYLAKWCHGYFSSHRHPKPISVKRLHGLSGSSNKCMRDFKRRLGEALTEVAFVEASERRSFKWRIDEDERIHVLRESGH